MIFIETLVVSSASIRTLGLRKRLAADRASVAAIFAILFLLNPAHRLCAAPIHDACASGNVPQIKALLKNDPSLVFIKDNYGATPLHLAAINGHKDVVELLLASRADANAKNNKGWTPLHAAAAGGHREVAQLLFASGADIDAQAQEGETPLHLAAMSGPHGYMDVVEFLLANKADVNARDDNGNTPLHSAAYTGSKDAAELLLANKAEVDVKTDDGVTPLHWAVVRGHKDVAELLREHGGHDMGFDSAPWDQMFRQN